MYIIEKQEVTQEIANLFDFAKPTMPRAYNVLEGITNGQIVVNDPAQPVWAVVRESVYGSLYFGGEITASLIPSIFNHFFQFGGIGIGCWLNDPLNKMLPNDPDYDGFTLYFRERTAEIVLLNFIEQLPSGYTLRSRDEKLLKQSFDYHSTLASFGSIENAMQYTLGVSLTQENLLICEAATGAPTHGVIEVGVTTNENFRHRGFATIACAKLIAACESHGYSTWWDCAKQNTPSVGLARKLGYCDEQEYRYVWWEKKKMRLSPASAQHRVHPIPGNVRRGQGGGSRRVFRQFVWLGVGSDKMMSSRPSHWAVELVETHQRVTPTVGRHCLNDSPWKGDA